jgi:hypothetical protein
MSAGYGRLALTEAVQAEQERHGSRRFYAQRQTRAANVGEEAGTAENALI